MALFILEGPRRPWWLTPVGIALALGAMFLGPHREWLVWLLLSSAGVGFFWLFVRAAERAYYLSIVKRSDDGSCPACGYSMLGLKTDCCPECGVDRQQFISHARNLSR